ncbi:hypothetical protein PG990_013375 [Apiospora arundinis]|uniref:Uncharacterized protein n=1 Tax=Apiospora arundinis TaxID=335852 RepID=A0ABR2HT79_9PEZI
MDNHQSPDGAAPQMPPTAIQMPLDLSVYDDENDYFNAAKCNYILQRALKNKDDIAAIANRNIIKIVEDMRLKVQQELQNLGKLQADEVNEAIKKLRELERSQPEIDCAQAYLVGRTSPGIAPHGELRELVDGVEADVKGLLRTPSKSDHSKPIVFRPASSTSARPVPTPSVARADNQQHKPQAAQASNELTLHNATETGFGPKTVAAPATRAPQIVAPGPTKTAPISQSKPIFTDHSFSTQSIFPPTVRLPLYNPFAEPYRGPRSSAPPGNKSLMSPLRTNTEHTGKAGSMPPPTKAIKVESTEYR